MSTKEKKPKKSTSSKKSLGSKKSKPTSAEYIVDSDVDADSGVNDGKTSKKSTTKHSKGKLPTKELKRKATDKAEPSVSKKKKTASASQDNNGSQSSITEEESNHETHINGDTAHVSNPREKDSPGSSSSESEGSSPPNYVNGVSRSISKTSNKEQHAKTLDSRFVLDSSDSSSAESEDGADEEADDTSSPESPSANEVEEAEEVEEVEEAEESDEAEESVAILPPVQSNSSKIPPYRPPENFSAASIDKELTTNLHAILSTENLRGKHLWHITAPASVPIQEIKQLTRADILNGKCILSNKESTYGFNVEAESGGIASKILIPARKGNKYQPISKHVDLNLHLRRLVELPDAKDNSSRSKTSSESIAGARKATLQQPPGLRLRYRPFGDVDDAETDQEAAKQAKQRINNAQIPSPSIPSTSGGKAKKSKKNLKPDHEPTEWVDPQVYSAPVVVGKDSQHTIDVPSAAIDERQHIPDEAVDPEERARKKAEKIARKEARKQRKEAKAAAKAKN